MSSVCFPVVAPRLSQEPHGQGLGGAGKWWCGGKTAVSMRAQVAFVHGDTSRGCPLAGRLEHTTLAALVKDQGCIWAIPTLTPHISRRKLFQDLIVLMVRTPISGLVHDQF